MPPQFFSFVTEPKIIFIDMLSDDNLSTPEH